MENELKPCPFCQCEPKLVRPMGDRLHNDKPPYYGPEKYRYSCSSNTCCAMTNCHDTEEEARTQWNTRPAAPVFLTTEDGECNGNENWEGPLTDEEQGLIDAAWETHKAAKPAPVDGLETVEWQYWTPKSEWKTTDKEFVLRAARSGEAIRELVTRSQAEAIIAAKDAELKAAKEYGDKWFKYYSDLREPFELNKIERRKLETQLAATRKALQLRPS